MSVRLVTAAFFTSEGAMLCLTRTCRQSFFIGDSVVVKVLRVIGNTVEIGIDAPQNVKILRAELEPYLDEREQSNDSTRTQQEARGTGASQVPGRDNRSGQDRQNPRKGGQPHHRGAA